MIRVARNAAGNCVIFHGQTNPTYFNACLTAEVVDTDYVSIRNDIATGTGDPVYEYYRIHFSEWQHSDFSTFASAADAVDYINSIGNVTDAVGTGTSFGPEETLDFVRDETNTSILLDNGDHHGVNGLKAVAKDNGRLGIETIVGGVEWYELDHTGATINGTSAGNTLASVVNALNALFTVSALGGVIPAPVYTIDGGTEITWNAIDTIDPVGDGLHGNGTTGTKYHGPRVYTTETIDEPGEYFTFEAKNTLAGGGPLLGIGLYSVNNGDLTELQDTGLSNSGTHGYFFSTWLYNYNGYSAPWTTYGSHSTLVYGPGWNGAAASQFRNSDANTSFRDTGTALFKCGITDGGFVGIWYYDVEVAEISGSYGARTNDWILLARSGTPLPEGQYGLMVKIPTTSGHIMSAPTRFATDPVAPTLYHRYIESPDGQFDYPLFSSAEEANYVDTQNGGIGESDTNIYVDDPTNTTWYSPSTGFLFNQGSAPVDGGGIVYTEIATDADSGFVPSPFSVASLSVMEGQTVNFQTQPQDTNYVTTITGLPTGLVATSDGRIIGDAPYVSEDTTYSVDVARTNEFGTSTGTMTLIIADNVAASAITGWTIHQGNTLAPNTIFKDEHSVLQYDTQISPGEEITWSHADSDYMIGGFLNVSGESLKTTNDLALSTTAWGVSYSIWPGMFNHLSQKDAYWDNNDVAVTNDSEEWKFKYRLDGYVEMYKGGVLIATSTNTFTGAQTFTVATPQTYSQHVYVPALTIATSVFAGDPPAGFESSPITYGSMDDATTLGTDSVVALDMELGVGERLVVTKSFVETNMLPNLDGSLDKNYFGVPDVAAAWGSVDLHSDFDAVIRLEWLSGDRHKLSQTVGDSISANHATINSATTSYYAYAIEWDGTDLHVIAHANEAELNSEYGVADGGTFDRVFTFSNYDLVRAGNLPLVFATKSGGGMTLTTTGFSKVSIPAAPAGIITPWTKALDFSGSSERAEIVSGSPAYNPMLMDYQSVTTSAPGTAGNTSSDTAARPWATAVVFSPDGNNSNQHIWNIGEGAQTLDDNIYLRISASRDLYFGWGRDGALNEYYLATVSSGSWNGVYVGFNGTRLSGADATPANLAAAFDIRLMFTNGTEWVFNPNPTAQGWGQWTSSGGRMDRSVTGWMNIGGRGTNRSFHGKVASFVTTTLQRGVAMPDATEIETMVTDPVTWLNDYKIGNSYRPSHENYNNPTFALNGSTEAGATQVWLMGDGNLDSYSNMIRNIVSDTDQNYTKLNLLSMVSNDIQTVTIPGLS